MKLLKYWCNVGNCQNALEYIQMYSVSSMQVYFCNVIFSWQQQQHKEEKATFKKIAYIKTVLQKWKEFSRIFLANNTSFLKVNHFKICSMSFEVLVGKHWCFYRG